MRKLIAMGAAVLAAVALAACRGNGVTEVVVDSCNGPWGKSLAPAVNHPVNGNGNSNVLKIECRDGSVHYRSTE